MKKPLVFRYLKGEIATIVAYLRGKKATKSHSSSKVINMVEKNIKGKSFKKSDLGYYDDEGSYESALKAYQEKKGKK